MIDFVDNLLRQLFLTSVPGLTSETQVGFQPPDESWRSTVATLTVDGQPAGALNVYLVDLREHRQLRSTEATTAVVDGVALREPPPARVQCRYLVTAWSPSIATPAVEPTVDEHRLLGAALAALFAHIPLNPSRIYPPRSPALAAIPDLIRDADLPTAVVPPDGFRELPFFWGAMGNDSRWKPGVFVVVTVPVALPAAQAGPLVTSRVLEFRLTGTPGIADRRVQIAGAVRHRTGAPVPGAEVGLETSSGVPLQTTETSGLGRFTFGGLDPGPHRLRARAPGLDERIRDVRVPSDTGDYDVTLG